MARIRANFFGGVTNGTASDDIITGSLFTDIINAGGGNDVIDAGDGNDVINGGAGADVINGGAGTDTVTYATAAGDSGYGVSVDLVYDKGFWGEAQGDTYTSIENVTGSQFRDAIRGDAGNNVLNGLGGDDVISGGAGADTMNGGSGTDTLSYFYFATPEGAAPQQSTGVSVNLATNVAFGGHAQGDVISNFENVRGSAGADTLTGNEGDNTLEGYSENDVLRGGGGRDTLDGGTGNDTIFGGTGIDTIIGGRDNDTLFGGADADTFVFNATTGGTPGNDFIMDFQHGVDHIRIFTGDGMDSLNFTQVGENTVITYDHTAGSLTLVGVGLGEISTSDFEVF